MRSYTAHIVCVALLAATAAQGQRVTTTNWDGETVVIGPTTDKWGDSWTGVLTTLSGSATTPLVPSSSTGSASSTITQSSPPASSSPLPSSSSPPKSPSPSPSRQAASSVTPAPSINTGGPDWMAQAPQAGTIADFTSYLASLNPKTAAPTPTAAALHVSRASPVTRLDATILAMIPMVLALSMTAL